MPYGIPAERGGESEKNVGDMEAAVSAMVKRGLPKAKAIATAKVRLGLTSDAEADEYHRTKRKNP